MFSLSALEAKLVAYVNDEDAAEQAFDASSIPKISREQAQQESARTSTNFRSSRSWSNHKNISSLKAPALSILSPHPLHKKLPRLLPLLLQQKHNPPTLNSSHRCRNLPPMDLFLTVALNRLNSRRARRNTWFRASSISLRNTSSSRFVKFIICLFASYVDISIQSTSSMSPIHFRTR